MRGLEERPRCSSWTRAGKKQRLHIVKHSEAGEGVCGLWRPRDRRRVLAVENRTEGCGQRDEEASPRPSGQDPRWKGKRGLCLFTHAWTLHMEGLLPHVGVFCTSRDLSLLFIKAWDFLPRKSQDSMKRCISLCFCKTDPKAFFSLSISHMLRAQDALTAGHAERGARGPFYAGHVAGTECGITHTRSSPGPLA